MGSAITSTSSDQYPVWDAFLNRWPLGSLRDLTLDDYTAAGSQDTFSYWLESGTEKLGSIWGGSAFKFGIFSRKDKAEPESRNAKYVYTETFAWRSNAGATAGAAFARVKDAVVRIAENANAGRIDEIRDDVLWPIVVWKIAFLYQDRGHPTIIPVFKKNALRAFVGDVGGNVGVPDLQRRVMAGRGDKDLMDFAREVWTTSQERLGTAPLSQAAALEFLADRFESIRPPVQYMAGFQTENGRPLALDRQTQTVGVFLQPCELNIDGVEITKKYATSEPRHSNLSAHAPELAEGHEAIKVRVTTPKALADLADAYEAGEGDKLVTANEEGKPLAESTMEVPLNQILYGPPGTGKTYATVDKALAILDPQFFHAHADDRAARKARFDELLRMGLVQFVTFHQSFSYEDFVEGIRAETDAAGQLRYFVADGIVKALCDAARSEISVMAEAPIDVASRRTWKMSLGTAEAESHIFEECIKTGRALLGWGSAIGQEYEAQSSHTTDDGRRLKPDVIVNLPGGQRIVIDAKVSLVAFESHVNAETQNARDKFLLITLSRCGVK